MFTTTSKVDRLYPAPNNTEFARQLLVRLVLAGAFLSLDLAFLVFGGGVSSLAVVFAYAPYLLVISSLVVARKQIAARGLVVTFLVVAFIADFLFIATQLHLSGGGWWHGASFYVLVIVLAASTVPPRALATVTCLGVLIFVSKGVLEIGGVLAPPVWGDFPRPVGNSSFLWNYAGFGAIAMLGAAIMQSRLMDRIRRAQQRYRTVVDASPYLVITLDKQGTITTASRIAEHITGLTSERLIGMSFRELLHDSEQLALAESLARAARGERFRQEFQAADVGDSPRWYGMGFAEIDADGGRDAIVVILRNMTAERQRGEERARMERQLEEARRLELVGRLVSGVAHELNNPLSAILTLAEQLENEQTPHASSEIRVIHEQARRARAIVRDLLQVVRTPVTAGREPLDLRTVVTRALEGVETRPESKRVHVVNSLDSEPCFSALEDGALEQVVTNLVVNGMQACALQGRVDVTVSQADGWVFIAVRDTGAGIDEATRARLFEPFFTTRAPGQGTGLGLAVSRAIVERHGGTLTLESSSDAAGTCFVVRLPDASEAATLPPPSDDAIFPVDVATVSAPASASTSTPASALTQRSVLIIDDEESIRHALSRWFSRHGWHVTTAIDGAQGLTTIRSAERQYDAILCDLKMPGTSGMAVYRALEAESPALLDRLVIATGDVASVDVAAFLSTVNVPILEKPFALNQLADVLEQLGGTATVV